MTKNWLYIVLIMLLAVCEPMAAAQTNKKKNGKQAQKTQSSKEWKGANRNIHHVAMWGGGGYSGLMNKFENSKFVGGGGGLLGVGYEYKYDHFILKTGAEVRVFSSLDKITFPSSYDVTMMADGYNQTKHYTFSDGFKENHLAGQAMLPIMVGGIWNKMYFMAGMKVGYTFLGKYNQDGKLSTSITDNMAYDPNWENMSGHGAVKDAPYSASGNNAYGLDVAASAEVGVYLNGLMSKEWNERNNARKHPWHMRLAVFADYGVMSLTPAKEGAMAAADDTHMMTRSLHMSDWASGRLNSLLVGVKFTALLQMNKPQQPKPQKPAMVLIVSDSQTSKAIAAATVEATPTDAKKPKTTKRSTNKKGYAVIKTASGPYHLRLTHMDYMEKEQDYMHGEWDDTLMLSMTPRPDYRLYVRDAKSDSVLKAAVTFINASNEAVVATLSTDSLTGYAAQRLPVNTPLRIHIEAANHLALTEAIEDIGGEKTYRLEPIVKKRAIILHNLFFATNKTTILPQSEPALQDLYDLMKENPELRIRITGHTDNVGSDKANQKLSEGRAKSVRENLIQRGIKANRIEAEGKGETQPIDTNDTEEGRQNNRRVEFMIL